MVASNGKTENARVAGQWSVHAMRSTEVWGINRPNEAAAQLVYMEMIRHPEAKYTELIDPDGYVIISEGVDH